MLSVLMYAYIGLMLVRVRRRRRARRALVARRSPAALAGEPMPVE
jgi:hypothetical protein